MWSSIWHLLLLVQGITAIAPPSLDQQEPPKRDYGRICPLPACKKCPTVQEITRPGVGFALEMGYGTVVTRLSDGNYQHVARIEGSPSYKKLLHDLATGPSYRVPDHFDTAWEEFQYLKELAQQRLIKLIGRPANPQAATLIEMVDELKKAAEKSLGVNHIPAAVLTSPARIDLTAEEISDVFDYFGMTNLMAIPDTLEDLDATSAAYAGFGMGLCTIHDDVDACEREEWYWPTQRLLHLDLSPESLSGTIKTLSDARKGSVDQLFVDFDSRYDISASYPAVNTLHAEDNSTYWTLETDRIHSFVASFNRQYLPQMTKLVLTGPSASDKRFHTAIKDALYDLVTESVLTQILGEVR